MRKLLTLFLVLTFVVFAGAAFAADKDVLVVGTEGTYPPFEFHDETGALVGYDIDLVNALADKMGVEVKWVDMAFDGLIPALLTQKIDMVAACMSVTSERSKKVNFSDPYIITYSAFVTPADNETIKGIDDLKGKKVSVQLGTTEDLHVSTIESVEVKKFNKLDDAVREVTLGRVDAAFMDEPVAKDYVGSKQFEGKLKVAFTIEIEGAPKALALNKEDTELLEKVNKALAEAKEEGLIEKLNEKWNQ